MRRFIKKYYIQMIVISMLAALVIGAIFWSHKIFVMIKTQSDTLKQTQMDQVLAQEYLQNIHVFKKDATYIHENNENFNILLPDRDDDKVQLFSLIENIAKETGNQDVTFVVKKQEKSDKAAKKSVIVPQTEKYIGMAITLTGGYDDLIMFLRKMENMQYMSDVLAIKIVKIVDKNMASAQSADEEDEEDPTVRNDLLKSEINAVFYLDQINK